MGQGGAVKTDVSEELARILVEHSKKYPALQKKITDLLSKNQPLKDESSERLLNEEEIKILSQDKELLKTIIDHFEKNPEELRALLEQANKVDGMEEKLDDLDEQLLISNTIAKAGLATSGVLIGLMAGGPAGALIGLVAVLGILMFAALFENRGAIKEGVTRGAEYVGDKAKDMGQGVMQSLKGFINAIAPDLSHAEKLYLKVANEEAQERYNKEGNPLPNDVAFVGQYLLNKDGLKALEEQIEKSAGQKVTLKGTDGEDVVLKLEDLKTLQKKGDSKFKGDKGEFKDKLDKFKLIMSETNKDVRKQVEAKQDEILKYSGKPAPSSASYLGSIANIEFLEGVGDKNRRGVKNLLAKVAELKDTGKNEGFRQDFHKFAKESYNLDTSILEKRGRLTGTESKDLADKLKELKPTQIEALNKQVDKLKKEQSKGPAHRLNEMKKDPEQHAQKQGQKTAPGLS